MGATKLPRVFHLHVPRHSSATSTVAGAGLMAENALLPQQLIVAQRKIAGRCPVGTVAALHQGARRGLAGRMALALRDYRW